MTLSQNALDIIDISNGTWTPTLDGSSSGTTSYTTQQGYYTRYGSLCILTCYLVTTSATGTGDLVIGGLPFTIKSQSFGDVFNQGLFSAASYSWPSNTTQFLFRGLNNTQTVKIWCQGSSATNSSYMQMSNIASTFQFSLYHMI